MLDTADNILNNYTMYRVVLYGLSLLLAIAAILGLTGMIGISATQLIASIAVLTASCYVTNKAFSLILKVPTNSESWLITALILACLLPQAHSASTALYTALAGVLAIASKFIIQRHGNHILNPAAFGAFVVTTTNLLPATWWIATTLLTPFTALLALAVLRKQRNFALFIAFGVAAGAMLILTGPILQGVSLMTVIHTGIVSWPIIFFGSIMLTEPATLPPTRYYQILFAIIVGLLFTSQLHIGRFGTAPETVLLIGNILTALALPAYGYILKIREIRQLAPTVYEVSFARPATLRFQPGQHAELTLSHSHPDDRGNRRTFSIASSATATTADFAFRLSSKSSTFKSALLKLKPNDTLRISHIAGSFTLPKDDKQPLLLIAGGIGITPFHSMITSLNTQRDIILLYITATPQDVIYRNDFQQARALGVQTAYINRRLNSNELSRLVPDLGQRLIYISGPDAMVDGYKRMLRSMGIGQSAIKTDHFSGY